MIDDDKIKQAVKLFLVAIGENPERDGLRDTPKRIINMCHEFFCRQNNNLDKLFECEGTDIIIEKNISFYSLCEHHLLPFFGVAHIAYIPEGKVMGISKIARCVEICAGRLQIQERLTNDIAIELEKHLGKNKGIMIMLEAEHMCVSMRGIKKPGAKTVTYVAKGLFKENSSLSEKFFTMIKKG